VAKGSRDGPAGGRAAPGISRYFSERLSKVILDLATSLAAQERGELHIVHAWELQGESSLRHGRNALPKADVDAMVRAARSAHEHALERLLAKYERSGLSGYVHVLKGRPADVIRRQAAEHRVELIIMGTVGRTGVPGFFIGNTAENVLTRADCSVLTVKPADFVSPVKLEA
jgi:universal stress protein E